MSTPHPLTHIALIGATGNLGPHILHALHTHPFPFQLTILTRSSTTTTTSSSSSSTKNNTPLPSPPTPFPPSIKIIQSPNDHYTSQFLEKVLKGIDAVVLSLAAAALGEQQKGIIDACVKAGVRRVVLSEWGSDTTNPLAVQGVPLFEAKAEAVAYAKKVVAEQADGEGGRLSWSAVVTGPFYDWCLKLGFCGIDVKNRKVTLYDEGKGEFTATTLTQIGRSVASLLTQPTKFANTYTYISSITITQAGIFAAVKAATGTETTDWTVENKSAEARMQEGREKAARGDIHGTYDLIFGSTFGGSKYGSDYGNRREISNKELGLEEEDLERVTREVLGGKRPLVEW